ncbi:galactose mutarotase [Jeotgalibacillus sp. S-D1]|uniref:aldose epimerase family protein n=1 Tax=Jeotgalibacillus sp. S-D1 TaxID=2552189 RepID=UPI0010592DE4|nr:aldose epimerase family protein [Jeotgalibacillus sp. S-D1]TDL32942.1 galactose mutarotase [Jeotgalibacillus sp. S-D1]
MISITICEIAQHEGNQITEYKLKNNNGMEVHVLNYGCIITKWTAKDRHGEYKNIVLGFDEFEPYLTQSPYFGAVIGRVAGRIDQAAFTLQGETYTLEANQDKSTLHGGEKGFDKFVWDVSIGEGQELIFSRTSVHLEGGFPGNLEVKVIYRLLDDDTLEVQYEGTTDQATIINMTNHSYFNLRGDFDEPVVNHELQLKSSRYLPLKEDLIPTGKLAHVEGTAFDFREPKKIGDGIRSAEEQIKIGGNGFDHPLSLDDNFNEEIQLIEPVSGRKLTIETDQKSVVLYTGNQMDDGSVIRGTKAQKHMALCLETQNYPNAINEPDFPSIELQPGEKYSAKTRYIFTVS